MIAGLVLAAGASSRLRGPVPKQLLELDGRPLVQHAVDAAAGAGLEPVVVVVGHLGDRVEEAVSLPAGGRVVSNPEYRSGQAGSLKAGLAALPDEADAAVILLGDQPGVESGTIRLVVGEFLRTGTPIVQARYGDGPGHPVLLGREVWPLLESLTGDRGARDVIAAHPELRTEVTVAGPAPRDVDTTEEYEGLREPDK
jgi:CTP:molybdopterin cytidylyltransferase MocA